jgi:hypothetical protein
MLYGKPALLPLQKGRNVSKEKGNQLKLLFKFN